MGPSVWGRLVNKHSGTTTAAQQFEPVISIGASKEKRTPARDRGTLTIRKLILLLRNWWIIQKEGTSRIKITTTTNTGNWWFSVNFGFGQRLANLQLCKSPYILGHFGKVILSHYKTTGNYYVRKNFSSFFKPKI